MDDCGNPGPEGDIEIARKALSEGDLRHATFHVACALANDPSREEWLALLSAIVDRSDDPLSLVPLENQTYFALVAVRTFILARRKELDPALSLLLQVAAVKPEVAYLPWAVRWVSEPGAVRALDAAALGRSLMNLLRPLQSMPTPLPDDDARRRNLESAVTLAALVRELHPKVSQLSYVPAAALRRLGRFDDAVSLARAAYEAEPAWLTAIAVAAARRDAGDVDGAVAAYRMALKHDDADLSARLDIGDILLGKGRTQEALSAFEEVLARESRHAWAYPAALHCRIVLADDAEAKQALVAWTRAHPDDGHAARLLRRAVPPVPFVDEIPAPVDATANVTRQIVNDARVKPSTGPFVANVTLSHPEAPSNLVALRLGLASIGRESQVTVHTATTSFPDPRRNKGEVSEPAWRLEGEELVPAVDPPPTAIANEIAAIAMTPFSLSAWDERAAVVGRAVGASNVRALVATMVHPPPMTAEGDAPSWVMRVQVAAALAVAHVDGGWEVSTRRRVLHDLLLGPTDWTTVAAIVALASLGRSDPRVARDVDAWFEVLRASIPAGGFCCFALPLRECWLWLPSLPSDKVARIREERARLVD